MKLTTIQVGRVAKSVQIEIPSGSRLVALVQPKGAADPIHVLVKEADFPNTKTCCLGFFKVGEDIPDDAEYFSQICYHEEDYYVFLLP